MTTTQLGDVLTDFHARVRASAPVKKLLARWDRTVELRAGERSFFLCSKSGEMLPPTTEPPCAPDITVTADEAVLRGVFAGEINPARAHLDGKLQAYGSQKDQLVLDAIVLLVWGH